MIQILKFQSLISIAFAICGVWKKRFRVFVGEEKISLGGDGVMEEWLWACGSVAALVMP